MLLKFKVPKLDQILCVDKTGFLRPGHKFVTRLYTYLVTNLKRINIMM